MRLEIIQCETCKEQHNAQYVLPDEWITIKQGHEYEESHFCSAECLVKYFGAGEPTVPLQEAPQTKMRRFLLVDGETAEEFEGVVWSDGCVTRREVNYLETSTCISWENFKHHHEGSGVQWIDQEVKEEVLANA